MATTLATMIHCRGSVFICMSCDARSVSRPLVRLGLLQVKVAAAERPQETDNDQKIAALLGSHCVCVIGIRRQSAVGGTSQALRSTKSMRATTRMSPSKPPPMYMLISKLFV